VTIDFNRSRLVKTVSKAAEVNLKTAATLSPTCDSDHCGTTGNFIRSLSPQPIQSSTAPESITFGEAVY
jgi:hypothetical protein